MKLLLALLNEIERNLSVNYSKILRESLIIRLVSIVEKYFYDLFFELSKVTKNPFKSNGTREFKIVKLLDVEDIMEIQNAIIDDKIRGVVLSGIDSTKRFINKNLKINVDDVHNEYGSIKMLYDIRHLLVHAGGRIDEIFASKYIDDIENIPKKINVSEEYFLHILEITEDFTNSIDQVANEKFNITDILEEKKKLKIHKKSQNGVLTKEEKRRKVILEIHFQENSSKEKYLNDSFLFGFTQKYEFKDIEFKKIKEHLENPFVYELLLIGGRNIIGNYIGFMKRENRQMKLKSFKVVSNEWIE